MKNYLINTQIASELPISNGDMVVVASDLLPLLCVCRENSDVFEPNRFIDTILERIGSSGTLIFSTFNWDFCQGLPFDYKKTPSQVGALSQAALRRSDFKRTRHPIYSFAVSGKHRDELCALDNFSAFAEDSPLAYFYRCHAKSLCIGADHRVAGFAFVHYIEEKVGVPYRFFKDFTAPYVEKSGYCRQATYRMYVRNRDLCEITLTSEKMDEVLEDLGCYQHQLINGVYFGMIDLRSAGDVLTWDLRSGGTLIYPKRPQKLAHE